MCKNTSKDFNVGFNGSIITCCHYLGFCPGSKESRLVNEVIKEANKDFARLSINAVENTIYIIQKLGYKIIKEKVDGKE